MGMNVDACVCIYEKFYEKLLTFRFRNSFGGLTLLSWVLLTAFGKNRDQICRWSRRNFVICRLTHMCVSLAVHCEIIGRTTTLFWFISRSGSSLDFASFFLLLRWKKYILNVWKEMVSNATCVCLSWAKRPRSYLIS